MIGAQEQKRGNDKGGDGQAAKRSAGPAAAGGAAVSVEAAGGNLEKIRDILFGAQVQDFDKRFQRLEDRLLKETSDARAETKKRFDALEAFLKKEVDSLSERIKTEQAERTESGKEISKELREAARGLEKKLAQLDDVTSKAQRELRQQILDQSKALTEEIRTRIRETATALTREIRDLRSEKTDRAALATLFTDAAMRLSNDPKPSAKE
jgi:phage host-nuclease inhibitor protein Gam